MSFVLFYFIIVLLIALALGHLAMFSLILCYGEILVREPILSVLVLETGAMLVIISLGIIAMVQLFRNSRGRGSDRISPG